MTAVLAQNRQLGAGAAASYDGVAPGARVAFFDVGDADGYLYTPDDLASGLFPSAAAAGAHIHSDSWGTDYNGYLADDVSIDAYSHEHAQFLVLVAGGNDGENGLHTIGSPAVSKNALSVGASETAHDETWAAAFGGATSDIGHVASFSSLGPTYDMRIKPDLVAPGYYITSANSAGYGAGRSCDLMLMAGTSMATPVVAGAAALVRHYFRAGHYGHYANYTVGDCTLYDCAIDAPSGALLKVPLTVNSNKETFSSYIIKVDHYRRPEPRVTTQSTSTPPFSRRCSSTRGRRCSHLNRTSTAPSRSSRRRRTSYRATVGSSSRARCRLRAPTAVLGVPTSGSSTA